MKLGSRIKSALAGAFALMALLGPGAAALPAPGTDAAAREAAPGREGIALLYFVSAYGGITLPLPVQELRGAGSAALAAALEARGLEVCAGEEIVDLMRQWRVRTDMSVSAGFLAEMSDRCAARRLAIARLVIYPDRIFLSARMLDATTGCLVWIDSVELPRKQIEADLSEESGWLSLVRTAAGDLAAHQSLPSPAPDAKALILLPTRAVAAGPGLASLFNDCLLKALLATGRWSIPDPALIVTELSAKGWRSDPLRREAISEMGARHGGAPILLSELVDYEIEARTAAFTSAEDSEGEDDLDFRGSHYCLLRAIDSRSGLLAGAWERYKEPERLQGLFGVRRSPRWLARFEDLATGLVHSMPIDTEVQ